MRWLRIALDAGNNFSQMNSRKQTFFSRVRGRPIRSLVRLTRLGLIARRVRKWGRRWKSVKLTLVKAEELPSHVTDAEHFLSTDLRLPAIWHALEAENFHVDEQMSVQGAEEDLRLEYGTDPGFFIRLKDAIVFPRWGIVLMGSNALLQESTEGASWFSPTFVRVPGVVQSRRGPRIVPPRSPRVIEGRHLLLVHYGGPNYGHWFLDCVPGALMFLPQLRRGELRLVAPHLRDWQKRVLMLLEVYPKAVTELRWPQETVLCTDLVFPSLHTGHHRLRLSELGVHGTAEGRVLLPRSVPQTSVSKKNRPPQIPPSTLIRETFRTVASAVVDRPTKAQRRIYVSREDIRPGRVMTNERQLINALERLGFISVNPEQLTIDQQVSLFSGARAIVGAVGAGLTNMGFAPSGCSIVEIMPTGFEADGWNMHLAGVLGHRYAYVRAEVAESRRTPVNVGGVERRNLRFEYEAPIGQVLETVQRALEAERSTQSNV
jgi:capsular polysaccharide biosynthesis protein